VREKATLWKRTGLEEDSLAGIVIAANWKEATRKVEELFGFESRQFRQVIMLPQDKFRQLLKANSSEREEIFKTLFQTALYERIELALKSEAKALEDEIRDRETNRRFILEQAQVASENELTSRQQEKQLRLDDISAHVTALREEERQAQGQLRQGEEDSLKIAEKETAESSLYDMESKLAEFDEKRSALAHARRAAELSGVESALLRQVRDAADAEQKRMVAQTEYGRALDAQREAAKALAAEDQRADERATAQRELERLRGFHEKVGQLDKAQQQLVAASGKVAVARQECDTANSKWKVLQERFNKLQQALRGSENVSSQTNACRVAEESAKQAYEQQKRLAELSTQLQAANKTKGEAEGRLQEAERKVAQARAVMNTIEVAWYEGQAAILARRLSVDVPCPV
jgi:exonuclease SbcC